MERPTLLLPLLLLGPILLAADSPRRGEPLVENLRSVIERVKLQPGAVPVRLFAQGEKLTVNVVTPTSPIPAHTHAKHEEVVYVVKGSGTMELAGEKKGVREGDIIYIPRKTVHAFTPKGKDCQVLSIFAPAFDGKDRIFVEGQVK
jgi:quercetin dioxygenase-like cupin family protein